MLEESTRQVTQHAAAGPAAERRPLQQQLVRSIQQSRRWLLEHQHQDGYWCGELEGDSILESEYVLLLAWLGQQQSPTARKAARYLLEKQLPGGGWAMYPGGEIEVSGSVKAYFALKLTGHDSQSEPMQRARRAIRDAGGADAVNSFTRFYLALLGQIDYEHCPAVPPEAVLLPAWFPASIYRISAWSRTILVPLSIMWAIKPRRVPGETEGIRELFLRPPQDWPALTCPGSSDKEGRVPWQRLFRWLDRALKLAERLRLRPLRRLALRRAERWMLDRCRDSDGLGAIFPPIVWSVVALRSLGYAEESQQVQEALTQLRGLIIEDRSRETVRLQPCKSPVWDTALALRSLAASGGVASGGDAAEQATGEAIDRAVQWLLAKEVRREGDWSKTVDAAPAGWFFEHHNPFYPDVDDTVMVSMALAELIRPPGSSDPAAQGPRPCCGADRAAAGSHSHSKAIEAACRRAIRWTLAMQNRDGGWGAFDKNNDSEFLCQVPFADHNAMIDPSTPDITARVVECLAQFDMTLADPPIARAVACIRSSQQKDGSWIGRWGVNYIYGTWQVLAGLRATGVPVDDPAVVRGARWLIEHQHPDGAWGESAASYANRHLAGVGPPTASQTSWAILGLVAAGMADDASVTRAVRYLVETQRPDGGWDETAFTGTGFPLVFYLRYHMYPIYFPLLALATWNRVTRVRDSDARRL